MICDISSNVILSLLRTFGHFFKFKYCHFWFVLGHLVRSFLEYLSHLRIISLSFLSNLTNFKFV